MLESVRRKSAQLESAQPDPAQHRIVAGKVFLRLGFFFEPEPPKTSGRRVLMLVALLAALGVAGWWTYTNYLGAAAESKTGSRDFERRRELP